MDTIVRQWLDRLQSCDLEGLVDLYEPQAELRSWYETWRGHAEIEDGLTFARRWIRDIRIDAVEPVTQKDGTMVFETTVRGKIGRARVRHTWTVAGDRILDHQLALLRHEPKAAAT